MHSASTSDNPRPPRLRRQPREYMVEAPPGRDYDPEAPIYELPLSVLDLDAEDNPNVRPFDKEIHGKAAWAKWSRAHTSVDALTGRFVTTRKQSYAARQRKLQMEKERTAWHVMDSDVWSAVLGDPKTVPDLGNVRHHNALSKRIAATPEFVPILLQKALSARDNHKYRVRRERPDVFLAALETCRTLREVRRLVSLAVQTPDGRTLMRQKKCSAAVAHKLVSFIETTDWSKFQDAVGGKYPVEETTAMLLNWSHALVGGETTESTASLTDLWAIGLWTAVLADQPRAMRRFLQLGLDEGSPQDLKQLLAVQKPATKAATKRISKENPTPARLILLTLEAVRDSLRHTPEAFDGARAEMFSLLTGATLIPRTGVEVSFRTLLAAAPSDTELDSVYKDVLAELGCVRSLWELQASEKKTVDTDTLVTTIQRYAEYEGVEAPQPASSISPPATSSSVKDLKMILAYETSQAPTRQPLGLFATLIPKPEPREKSLLSSALVVDDAFRTEAEAAFGKESAEDVVQAIDAMLATRSSK